MERLTVRSIELNSEMTWFVDRENQNMRLEPCEMNSHHSGVAIRKLAKYEDLEEQCIKETTWGFRELLYKWKVFLDDMADLVKYRQLEEKGLLLRLPCPVGTKVYFINYHEDDDCGHYEVASGTFNYSWLDFPRKFYLTKEEAEQALKQMGEQKHE